MPHGIPSTKSTSASIPRLVPPSHRPAHTCLTPPKTHSADQTCHECGQLSPADTPIVRVKATRSWHNDSRSNCVEASYEIPSKDISRILLTYRFYMLLLKKSLLISLLEDLVVDSLRERSWMKAPITRWVAFWWDQGFHQAYSAVFLSPKVRAAFSPLGGIR